VKATQTRIFGHGFKSWWTHQNGKPLTLIWTDLIKLDAYEISWFLKKVTHILWRSGHPKWVGMSEFSIWH